MPFVIRLDAMLIGEIGIDAVDSETMTGEASTWFVRDHGADAVNVASMFGMQYAFTRERPMARIIGPASVAAREGLRGNLTALGFHLGPAVPRRVGDQVIDHDLWVLDNSEAHAKILDRASATTVMMWGPARACAEPGRNSEDCDCPRRRCLRQSCWPEPTRPPSWLSHPWPAAPAGDCVACSLRTSVVGSVDAADLPTFLDAVEAAAVAW